MTIKVSIEVPGLRDMMRTLASLPVELKTRDKTLMRALHDGARVIVPEAKRLAPVLQVPDPRRQAGAIRANITQHASKHEDFAVVIRVRNRGYIFGGGRGAESFRAGNPNYWWLVEFGTSKVPARPFMRPAFETKKFQALTAIKDSLRRGIDVLANQLRFRKAA